MTRGSEPGCILQCVGGGKALIKSQVTVRGRNFFSSPEMAQVDSESLFKGEITCETGCDDGH